MWCTDNRVIKTTIVLAFLFVCCGCVTPSGPRTQSFPEMAPGSTMPWFTPKVPLHSLRFVYALNGRLYMELSQRQDMLSDDVLASFPDLVDWEHEDSVYAANGILPLPLQQQLMKKLPEELGESYCLYYPESNTVEMRELEAVGLRPTGDGFFAGLWGRLGGNTDLQPDDTFSYRPVAIAFRSACLAHAETLEPPFEQVELDLVSMRKMFQPLVTTDEILKVTPIGYMYIEYPDKTMLLARLKGHFKEWLVCLWKNGQTWEPAVFSPWESPLEQIEGGESCGAPNDTKLFLLPDIDGDGSNELLVWTTTSIIYKLKEWGTTDSDGSWKKQYRMEEISRTYFGA